VLNQVCRRQKRVVVEKSGIPVAAIVSADDLAQLQRLEQQRAERFKALDRFAEPFKDERPEDIEREVAKAVKAARAELRTEAKQPTQHP
jgi:PHD/YefM family antitoxin component YafN of YafNO toxin-antitoxin module